MSVPKIRTSKPRRGTILLSVMSFVLILVIFTALGTHKFQSDSRTGLANAPIINGRGILAQIRVVGVGPGVSGLLGDSVVVVENSVLKLHWRLDQ